MFVGAWKSIYSHQAKGVPTCTLNKITIPIPIAKFLTPKCQKSKDKAGEKAEHGDQS